MIIAVFNIVFNVIWAKAREDQTGVKILSTVLYPLTNVNSRFHEQGLSNVPYGLKESLGGKTVAWHSKKRLRRGVLNHRSEILTSNKKHQASYLFCLQDLLSSKWTLFWNDSKFFTFSLSFWEKHETQTHKKWQLICNTDKLRERENNSVMTVEMAA